MEKKRIDALDGFRALAILLVLFFHYLSRWTLPRSPQNLYPYGDRLAELPVANYGYLGVELFFIVSGFVISMTLFSSKSWQDFSLRRFARLFPTMLLCSTLTFVVINLVPVHYFHANLVDFLPSLTLLDPLLWKAALHLDANYMDGAYWSLFVEVRFYFWACLVFFLFGKERFLLAFAVFFNVALGLTLLGKVSGAMAVFSEWVLFPSYLPWLTAGVGFFYLHRDGGNRLAAALVVETALVLLALSVKTGAAREIPFLLIFYALFAGFIYRPRWVSVFAWKPLTIAGAASYSLYLLHQDVGVSLISVVANAFPESTGAWTLVIPPVVALVLVGVSVCIFKYWEMPAKNVVLALGGRGQAKLRSA